MTYPMTTKAVAFLEGRGIDPAWAATHSVGEVTEPLEGHENYVGMIAIPYFAKGDEIVTWRFRNLGQGKKYLAVKGGGRHIYRVWDTEADEVIVTEGELDALLLSQLGYNAVGIPGARAWTREWRWLFRDARRVVLAADGDPDGREMAAAVATDVSPFTEVTLAEIPIGKDVTDVFLTEGEETLRRLLA